MGYWKQKAIDEQQEEQLEKLVQDYLGLFVFMEDSLVYTISEDGIDIIIEFDEDTAKDLEGTFSMEDGNILRVQYSDLDSGFGHYDEEEFDAIMSYSETYSKFRSDIDEIKKLVEVEIGNDKLQKLLYRQNFVSIIGTLESYLSEKLINKIFSDTECRKRFVKTHPGFKEKKFELREIFDKSDSLDKIIKKILLDQIYHNLAIVGKMYEATLEVDFPDIATTMKAVSKRHDLVHRNGKTKKGEDIEVTKDEIDKLCDLIVGFVDEIESEVEK